MRFDDTPGIIRMDRVLYSAVIYPANYGFIPHTLAATTLGTLRPGDRVNIEADILAKHVAKLLNARVG